MFLKKKKKKNQQKKAIWKEATDFNKKSLCLQICNVF